MLPYAGHVLDVPLSSSSFEVTDTSVPFLPIVLSGMRSYASTPVNLAADSGTCLLQALETGSMLHYLLSETDYAALAGSDYTYLTSIGYDTYREELAANYRILAAVHAVTQGSSITGHGCPDAGIARTDFANGATVAVNYTDNDAAVDGHAIPARGYAVWKGGRTIESGRTS